MDTPDTSMRTTNDAGKPLPPQKRFKNAGAFWDRYKKLYDEDNTSGRARKRSSVQGLVDGNPIYNDRELRADGEGWRANFNDGQAKSVKETNGAALWALTNSTETLLEVTAVAEVKLSAADKAEQCGKIAAEYTATMKAWDDFAHHELLKTNDVVNFGVGWLAWYDEYDFRYSYVRHGAVKYPPRMKSFIASMNVIFIEDSISARDLLFYATKEGSAAYGWNQTELKRLLQRRYGGAKSVNGNDKDVKYDTSEWESAQQQIKNDDWGDAWGDMEDVPVVWGFVLAPDGKTVSQYCVENTLQQPKAGRGYLLERHEKRQNMTQCVCPFFLNMGDGFIRSIRGQVQTLYPELLTGNRMLLSFCDGAILSSSVVVHNTGSNDMRLRKIGPITSIPADANPIQSSFQPRLDGLLMVRQMMASLLNQNAGVHQTNIDDLRERRGEARSAEEVRQNAETEAKLKSFQAMIYYLHEDRKHRECLRRLLTNEMEGTKGYEESKKFRDRLTAAGVAPELLKPENLIARAQRAVGYGSPSQARMVMEKLLQIAQQGGFDQIGQREAIRQLVALLMGWDQVDAFAPRMNRDQIATNETSIAALENDAILKGGTVVVGTDQNHLVHAQAVIGLLGRLAQQHEMEVRGQIPPSDPRQMVPAFQVGIPHAEQHIALLGQRKGNEGTAKALAEQLKLLEQAGKKIGQQAMQIAEAEQKMMQENAAQMQAEAAQRDPVLRAEARKDATTQADIQREDGKAAAEVQRKAARAQVDIQAKIAKTGAQMMGQMPPPTIPTIPTPGEM